MVSGSVQMATRSDIEMSAATLLQMRKEKDARFKNGPHSPLDPGQRERFTGLAYYPYKSDLDLRIEARLFSQQEDIQLQTNTGEIRWYRRYGEFTFEVADQEARLTIFRTADTYFVPFVDASAGTETYPAGRYLEPELVHDHTFQVDFNLAYNPFCAYRHGWSCPMTPAENRLRVAITAGEKIPSASWQE